MASYQIQCINKSDRFNAHERIINVGGIEADGRRWKITQQECVQYIDSYTHSFYVRAGGHTAQVITATSPYGNKYIKTTSDGEQPNNLLSLPECPA